MLYYKLNDEITLKKPHACGGNRWKILRTGVDIKLECLECNRQLWISRIDFEKKIRKILNEEGKWISIIHNKAKEDKEE